MARRRTKKDDFLAYPSTPDRQLETPSGWCITGHHEQCRFSFNHGKCGCSCHVSPVKKRGTTPKNDNIDEDPRPWKR